MIADGSQRKVAPRTIVSAVAMLAGLFLLAYGYFAEHNTAFYAGLILILGGVLTEITNIMRRAS